MKNKTITVEARINSTIDKVWERFTKSEHITKWAFATNDWEVPYAENDLRRNGKFTTRMSSKDKTQGFDFSGTYTNVINLELIEYTLDDGRKVSIKFKKLPDSILVSETFEAENQNSIEQQKLGWQSIMDNFKKYVESL